MVVVVSGEGREAKQGVVGKGGIVTRGEVNVILGGEIG